MLTEIAVVAALAGLATLALAGSNYLTDLGIPSSTSRYAAPLAGGLGFLVAVLELQATTAIALAAILTGALLLLRLWFRKELRGLQGNLPGQARSELTFAAAATSSLALGWGLLHDPWLAFVPIAFLAWGDSIAGIARASRWRNSVDSCWPSLLMLAVCLAIGALYQPAWIGCAGAIAATSAERWRPRALNAWDDNLHLVAASFIAMALLSEVS